MSLTFPANIKCWGTRTKKDGGQSSAISSGTQIPVGQLPKTFYVEGVSGSAAFRDLELKATYSEDPTLTDKAKVTVFEVTLTGKFAGAQQADNDVHHSAFGGSSDMNGCISWDDANGDGTKGDLDPNCLYFHNCMEVQGHTKPSAIDVQRDGVAFLFKQDKGRRRWRWNQGGGAGELRIAGPWAADDPPAQMMDVTPSIEGHLFLDNVYVVDGPGYRTKDRPYDYVFYVGDFRDRVLVQIGGSWYQCSGWYKWHAQLRMEPKNATELTRSDPALQLLDVGWISLPDQPW